LVIFRIGGDDAKRLESEMTPIFKAKDMLNLGMKEFYVKMTIDGNTYDPFSAETLNVMPAPHKSFKEAIIKNVRESYAMPVEEVKRKLEAEEKELLFGKKGKPAETNEEIEEKVEVKKEDGKKEGPAPMV